MTKTWPSSETRPNWRAFSRFTVSSDLVVTAITLSLGGAGCGERLRAVSPRRGPRHSAGHPLGCACAPPKHSRYGPRVSSVRSCCVRGEPPAAAHVGSGYSVEPLPALPPLPRMRAAVATRARGCFGLNRPTGPCGGPPPASLTPGVWAFPPTRAPHPANVGTPAVRAGVGMMIDMPGTVERRGFVVEFFIKE